MKSENDMETSTFLGENANPFLDKADTATNTSAALGSTTALVGVAGNTEALNVGTLEEDVIGSVLNVPGPTRLVLVDSNLFKGAISEVPLDGNTLITGTNAAGKTSLIQLMPLFYGAETQTISNKRHGKSFFKHYLPNATSYVAFEYRARDKQARSVVIYEDVAGESLVYRFVRSALYEDMFVQDNGEFVPNEDFVSHLRQRGYKFASRQISTVRDYRTIIQGGKPVAKKKGDQRHMNDMVMEYTLAPRGVVLQDAHKVVQAILKRKMSLPDLEKMIVNKILGEKSQVDVSADRESLMTWPKKYLAYQNVMKKADEARKVSLLLDHQQAAIKDRNDQLQFLVAFGLFNAAKRSELQKQENENEASREKAHKDFNELSISMVRLIEGLNAKLSSVEERIKNLKDEDAQLRAKKAPDLAIEEGRKDSLSKELRSLQNEINALESGRENISAHYDGLINQVKADFLSQCELTNAKAIEVRQEFDKDVQAMKAAVEMKRKAFIASCDEKLKQLSDELSALDREVGKKEQALKNPSVDKTIEDEVEAAEDASEKADKEYEDASALLTGFVSKHKAAEKEKREAQAVVDSLDGDKRILEREIRDLEARKQPAPGSLLAFLRKSVPGWEDTIGKVINPDLLRDKSLFPAQMPADAEKGFYGVQLNLDGLDSCAEADIEVLKTRILEKEAQVSELVKKVASANQVFKTASKEEEELAVKVSQEEARTARLKEKAVKMRERLRTAREKKKAALADVRRLVQGSYDASMAAFNEKKGQKHKAEEAQREGLAGFEQEEKLRLSELETTRDTALKAIAFELEENKKKEEASIADYEIQRSKALSDAGVDTKRLDKIRRQSKDLRKRLDDIDANSSLVARWRIIVDQMKTALPKREEEKRCLKANIKREEEKLEKERENWRAKDNQLLSDIKAVKSELKVVEARIDKSGKAVNDFEEYSEENERALGQLKKLVFQDKEKWLHDVSSLSFEEVHADYLSASVQVKAREKEIKVSVRSLEKVFRDSEVGSPPRQYIERYVVQAEELSQKEWVDVFKVWFNEAHNEQLNTLVREARAMLVSFDAMYSEINDVHRLVNSENTRLQKNLNKIPFKVIQDLQVRIVSKVEDLDFMEPLERLSKLYRKWDKSKDVHPPQEFGAILESLEGHWMGKQGISADLRECIKIEGQITENNNRREFNAYTDMMDISSNGMSYLVLTTILVGFINMVRQGSDVHFIWAVDELGDIDEKNTVALLDMLRQNKITMVSATPSTSSAISKMFDYRQRFKKINGEVVLVSIDGAGLSPVRMEKSPPVSSEEAPLAVHQHLKGDV